ncbi:hypothetical protein OG604_48665 [Streptomyces sp. NBC_01231]|nr:hypothetical protein OG604_48665 [Streptomyces sp. NBC_01231]
MPRTDRSPLTAAVADALDAYDVIVLLPRYWSYPDRESATAHVVLGEIDIFPHTDCRTALPGPRGEEKGCPAEPRAERGGSAGALSGLPLRIHKQLPEPGQLKDPAFVQRYQPIAGRLRTALDARPAGRN